MAAPVGLRDEKNTEKADASTTKFSILESSPESEEVSLSAQFSQNVLHSEVEFSHFASFARCYEQRLR